MLRDTSVSVGSMIRPSPRLRNRAGFDTRILLSVSIACSLRPALTSVLIDTRLSGVPHIEIPDGNDVSDVIDNVAFMEKLESHGIPPSRRLSGARHSRGAVWEPSCYLLASAGGKIWMCCNFQKAAGERLVGSTGRPSHAATSNSLLMN